MVNKKKHIKLSKFLSLILRHKPEIIQIQLDKNGWANVNKLIKKLNNYGKKIDFETLKYIVKTNSKKRFAFNEDQSKIRANQGHSLKIDLNYPPVIPPKKLYHGTCEKFLKSILKNGLEKRNRQHVHLTSNIETAITVGQRHGKPVVLEIQTEKMHKKRHKFYLSENKIWLTNYVPIEYIKIKKRHGIPKSQK